MNKVTQKEVISWVEELYNNSAVYVWGANGGVITKSLVDELYKLYGSETYNKHYYNSRLEVGKGKVGADSSGLLFKFTQEDRTVRDYYNACVIKGRSACVPRDKVCLVFNKNLTNLGVYLGNGFTIEMRNSKVNVIKEKFKVNRWEYFGIPDFIDYEMEDTELRNYIASNDVLVSNYQEWLNTVMGVPHIDVDGVYDENTKTRTVRLIQYMLNHYYGKSVEENGVFDISTKNAVPSFEMLTPNDRAFQMLTYIVHIYLYAKCGYSMRNVVNGSKVSTVFNDSSKQYIALYQSKVRGLEVNGLINGSTLYQMFK